MKIKMTIAVITLLVVAATLRPARVDGTRMPLRVITRQLAEWRITRADLDPTLYRYDWYYDAYRPKLWIWHRVVFCGPDRTFGTDDDQTMEWSGHNTAVRLKARENDG